MALVVIGMVAFSALQLTSVSSKSSEIINRRDKATAMLIRANRQMDMAVNSIFGTLLYDGNSSVGRLAVEGFGDAIKSVTSLLDEVKPLIPDRATELAKFRSRFLVIAEEARAPYEIGKATPSLELGSKLTADQLDQMSKGVKLVSEIDTKTRALVDEMVQFNNALLAENEKAASDLEATSQTSLMQMALFGLIAIVTAGAIALWISSAKIASPLNRLAERMRRLAAGDLNTDVEGQERGDEVGDMAKAVQIFKDNAISQVRLEAQATADRNAAQSEQDRSHAERTRISAEQAEVVRRLSEGLRSLASGDLTVELNEGFTEAYLQIKSDFNETAEKLKETIQLVVQSTEVIQAGTQEISTASNELARRTEQQAANLEETAAALDQVTATVKKSAEGAGHALQISTAADQDATRGAVVVRQTVEAMDSIANSKLSGLIGQFQVGRRDTMRQELKKVAPHAFRTPVRTTRPETKSKSVQQPNRGAAKAVVNGSPLGGDAGDWKEF
eukprot:gene12690-12785_t